MSQPLWAHVPPAGAPGLRQIQRAVDEGMTVARDVGGKHADLAIRDLAGGPGILARHANTQSSSVVLIPPSRIMGPRRFRDRTSAQL